MNQTIIFLISLGKGFVQELTKHGTHGANKTPRVNQNRKVLKMYDITKQETRAEKVAALATAQEKAFNCKTREKTGVIIHGQRLKSNFLTKKTNCSNCSRQQSAKSKHGLMMAVSKNSFPPSKKS